MKQGKILLLTLLSLLVAAQISVAGDYDWIKNFNMQAQADPSGFRAKLATRFNIGDLQVKAVLDNIDSPADAYMLLRLGEMSGRPAHQVIDKYRSSKNKGWGALAKSLGIKPGSGEFHTLKRGHDLHEGYNRNYTQYTSYDQNHLAYNDADKNKGKGNKGHKNKGKGKKGRWSFTFGATEEEVEFTTTTLDLLNEIGGFMPSNELSAILEEVLKTYGLAVWVCLGSFRVCFGS